MAAVDYRQLILLKVSTRLFIVELGILKPSGMHKLESVVQTQHRNNKNDTPDY